VTDRRVVDSDFVVSLARRIKAREITKEEARIAVDFAAEEPQSCEATGGFSTPFGASGLARGSRGR
jgi:hypothetical protein